MNRPTLFVCFTLAALLFVSTAPAVAQTQTRSLTIHDNTVHVNGKPLSKEELPSSLDVSGVEAEYRFLGIRRPIVEINGKLFAVTNTLEPVSEDDVRSQADASVILQRPQAQSARNMSQASTAAPEADAAPSDGASPEADAASDMEKAHQAYLKETRRQNQELYRKLMRERRMEIESREIARTIRLLPDGPERTAQIDTLRATLNRIFDLKQDNRRREIELLQRQIDELQRRLEQREQMRGQMIERRLAELIGTEPADASEETEQGDGE